MTESVYSGEILVGTAFCKAGVEKRVYTKKNHTFKKDGHLHLDANDDELTISYDNTELGRLLTAGLISTDDHKKLSEDLQQIELQQTVWKEWIELHPNASDDEQAAAFLEMSGDNQMDHHQSTTLAIRRLIAKKDRGELSQKVPALFNSIDPKNSFALTKALTDRLYRLPELLENIECEQISRDEWELTSKTKTKSMGEIGISHRFNAKNVEDAAEYKAKFASWLQTSGLKTLMAYWKEAGEKNKFQFPIQLTEVMLHTASVGRRSYFSTKEKREFWADTRKLENTKLTLQISLKGRGNRTVQVEHRLVDVSATIKTDTEGAVPTTAIIKVLNPEEFERQAQIGCAIHNNTLKLHPKDIMLALTIQGRGAQRRGKDLTFDENSLLNRANQTKTAQSNIRKARATLKKKLDVFVDAELIDSHSKSGDKHTIHQRKLKKST